MKPCLNAIAKQELLKHQDRDVKVLVATCICEITRITAPEAPYNDDVLKVSLFHDIILLHQGCEKKMCGIKNNLFYVQYLLFPCRTFFNWLSAHLVDWEMLTAHHSGGGLLFWRLLQDTDHVLWCWTSSVMISSMKCFIHSLLLSGILYFVIRLTFYLMC